MLMASGGAIEEPTTPRNPMSSNPRRAKMRAGAAGRCAGRAAVWLVLAVAFLPGWIVAVT